MRLISKIALMVVVLGFFMPVACSQNGCGIASAFFNGQQAISGIFMWLLFLSAAAGAVIGVMLLLKKDFPAKFDLLIVGVNLVSGIFLFFKLMNNGGFNVLQFGGFLILIGVIGAAVCQFLAFKKGE
jgi:hypothetical protein